MGGPPELQEAVGAGGPDGVVGWVWLRVQSAGLFPLLRRRCRGLKGGLAMQREMSDVRHDLWREDESKLTSVEMGSGGCGDKSGVRRP